MSVIDNGVITQLSVSQVERFDETQVGGCPRAWWFDRAAGLRPDEQTEAQIAGDAGHALLAHYLTTGEAPKGRPKMGKAVLGVIAKGDLPALGPDLLVEERFSGQAKFDADGKWVPLDTSQTLWLGGVPWEGFIDLSFRRGPVPEIIDHKFFNPADPREHADPYVFLKKPSELIKTVQLPVYVLNQRRVYWPDASHFKISHHCVSRKGVDSLMRSAVVSVDQVLEREAQISAVVERMKVAAQATKQEEVPANTRNHNCEIRGGCPHQSVCRAYRNKQTKGVAFVDLSPEEDALFAGLDVDASEAEPAAPAPVAPPPAPVPAAKPSRMAITNAPAPKCNRCQAPLSAANTSILQDGKTVVHVGCPAAQAPAPVVVPAAAVVEQPAIVPADAPPSKPELASEQPPAPKEPKARKTKAPPVPDLVVTPPAPAAPAPVVVSNTKVLTPSGELASLAPPTMRAPFTYTDAAGTVHAVGPAPASPAGGARAEAVAELLRSIAKLIAL